MRQEASNGYYSVTAHNENRARPIASSSQYGGCAATILNSVAHQAKSFGRDPTKLGRWADVRIQGRQREPREAFVVDLLRAITKWRDGGCEVILGVDANEDVSSLKTSSFRHRLREVGMEEAILQQQAGRTAATQQRNRKGKPIDGIFTTTGVVVKAGGYYNFDKFFLCDHWGLWIDIDLECSLGVHRPQKTPYQPRKLTMSDTTAVRRYLHLVHQGYNTYSISSRLEHLHEQLKLNEGKMTAKMGRSYKCLHQQMYDIRRKAEAKWGRPYARILTA
ncbi:unnamed protein product [Cylindrotheca closterium]|uniref:Uncharacterized protein n=1 Tax=Cylindrotheca closterium TaxID=2856 RepID=A0AAD2FVD0_9STRA|nr:unnamed protein product [Cylindrotheca closterium]